MIRLRNYLSFSNSKRDKNPSQTIIQAGQSELGCLRAWVFEKLQRWTQTQPTLPFQETRRSWQSTLGQE
jgi:hypothetical protein